ncbi:MAG TPA: VPLPA-CTERM sorting domain-containing protein [Chromatiaceae bacterium]|nr:VPLPA-CTERM sorting domain-containing protein [Chromatiaceae bacterium]
MRQTILLAPLIGALITPSVFAAPVPAAGLDSPTHVDLVSTGDNTYVSDCMASLGVATCNGTINSLLTTGLSNHQIWDFDLLAGDTVTIGLDITTVLAVDGDPFLYLLETVGGDAFRVTDDHNPFDDIHLISSYTLTDAGTYYVGVSGFGNTPTYVDDDIQKALTGWLDGDMNSFEAFEYDLTITVERVSEIPVPAAIWFMGSGLLALTGFSRRRKQH